VRVLARPKTAENTSFNWWVASNDPALDWGPNRRYSNVEFVRGNLGTPHGDRAKYQMMSGGEIDYDQVESAVDHTGWLPPVSDRAFARNLADGVFARKLLSIGPFDLRPDSSATVTLAIVAATDFHLDPDNFRRYFDPQDPSVFYEHLNFGNLALIAQTAGWVYDTPGIDTDGDGHRGKFRIIDGDTVFYEGDGVPDYRVSPAPPVPRLKYSTAEGKVVLRWNGEFTETSKDPFTALADFEGYRVYMSRTGHLEDYRILAQRDKTDWSRYLWLPGSKRWRLSDPPFILDSLKTMFDSICVANYGFAFHPDSFKIATVDKALLQIVFDERDPAVVDSNYYYFRPYDANQEADDRGLARAVQSGVDVERVIRKPYPDAPPDSVGYREDGSEFYPYYEYEYAIDGLQVAEPIFISVATFDFGYPAIGIGSLESLVNENAIEVWPINAAAIVDSIHPKPGVYPNPYRISDYYNAAAWENPRGLEPDPERARKVTFYNVPDTCTVSIWSLDGDLVRRLEHRADPSSSEATVVVWNLITRNTQAVKTGIYIWSIESRFGTDVGKLIIVK